MHLFSSQGNQFLFYLNLKQILLNDLGQSAIPDVKHWLYFNWYVVCISLQYIITFMLPNMYSQCFCTFVAWVQTMTFWLCAHDRRFRAFSKFFFLVYRFDALSTRSIRKNMLNILNQLLLLLWNDGVWNRFGMKAKMKTLKNVTAGTRSLCGAAFSVYG